MYLFFMTGCLSSLGNASKGICRLSPYMVVSLRNSSAWKSGRKVQEERWKHTHIYFSF